MRALLTFPYLTIYLHESPRPVLELQWLQFASSADFHQALLQTQQLSQQHQVRGWVVDDRLQGAIRPRDLEWAEQYILGPLPAQGVERFAHLEAEDAMNRRTVDTMYQRSLPTVAFAFRRFQDITLARAWASGTDA